MKDGSHKSTEGLLKIGELAKQTDTSLTTLKHYIREGLIRPVVKTGRNMSWYDPSCIETVNMIRMLQKERYYPLSVIKDLLETENLRRPPEMALLDAIHKVDESTDPKMFSAAEAARLSGLDPDQISVLSEAGVIPAPKKKTLEVFTEEDLAVMRLVRRRLDAGIPLEQSAAALRTYDRALRNAARDDIDLFVDLIMQPDFTAQAGTHMIRISDETLDEFVALRRKEYNRSYGKAYVEKLYRFMMQCSNTLPKLRDILSKYDFAEAASLCEQMIRGTLRADDPAAEGLRMFLMSPGIDSGKNSDLITRIIACQTSREYFSRTAAPGGGAGSRLLAASLRCLWLTMAPDALGCEEKARDAKKELISVLDEISPENRDRILSDLL